MLFCGLSKHALEGGNCDLGYESILKPVQRPEPSQDSVFTLIENLRFFPRNVTGALLQPCACEVEGPPQLPYLDRPVGLLSGNVVDRGLFRRVEDLGQAASFHQFRGPLPTVISCFH
eukprot:1484842-Amphidinium_carterae.2